MNLKALTLGAVIGFVVAVIPACGGGACGPGTCDGCCDANDACVPLTASSSNSACGKGGATCADCSASSKTCESYACTAAGTGGGAGATGGGSASTGGGSASTGGGSASTGGGSASTGGGSASTGGGSASTGGGSASTGGGSASTGGGSASTGGGSATGGGAATGGSGGATGCNPVTQTGCQAGESCLGEQVNGNLGTRCFAGACDVVAQTCGANLKCDYGQLPDGGTARGCGATGTATAGQTCNQTTGCAAGLFCLATSQTMGTCTAYCYSDQNCPMGQRCFATLTIPNSSEHPFACVTVTSCDPLAPNCQAGDGCYLEQSGSGICNPAGTVAIGQTCTGGGTCVPGAECINTQSGAACHQLCNTDGGMPTCGSGTCNTLTGMGGTPLAGGIGGCF